MKYGIYVVIRTMPFENGENWSKISHSSHAYVFTKQFLYLLNSLLSVYRKKFYCILNHLAKFQFNLYLFAHSPHINTTPGKSFKCHSFLVRVGIDKQVGDDNFLISIMSFHANGSKMDQWSQINPLSKMALKRTISYTYIDRY